MSAQQFGESARDFFNVARDVNFNYSQPAGTASAGSETMAEDACVPAESPDGNGLGVAVWIIAIGILAFLLTGLFSQSSAKSGAVQMPARATAWPSLASTPLVLAPVTGWLASCAGQVVLSPLHCPQSASSGGDEVSDVHWTLHGDPGDGAVIRYSGGTFWIIGHAVMTVTYNDSGSQWQLNTFGYEATVTWNNGHPALASPPQAVSLTAGPPVAKHDPDLPWAQVSAAVMAGFRQCAAGTVTPLPAQCMNIGPEGSHAAWKLIGNPLLDAAESFDPATGLIHVTGSYAMTVAYRESFWDTPATAYPSGHYDAMLSLDGTKITLLQIAEG